MAKARRKPVTEAELESFLDYIARQMDLAGRKAVLLLPIWRAVERELNAMRNADAILAAARERLTRSSGRTEAQS